MAIVCVKKYVSQGLQYELTYGKSYEVLPFPKGIDTLPLASKSYYIRNDRGEYTYYDRNVFISLDEWRQKQIEKIYEDR